ncbi:methyl-accepting chemotaxis protein [Clostridium thermarum]|uniref:methyl-accepting chemotaxis protein n=1 Tax=Clostridium thermarum TaxID=1716543 RepID=UPI001124111A|nr:methyl-accepting chemotaxis protein [Clostridium thermarum]
MEKTKGKKNVPSRIRSKLVVSLLLISMIPLSVVVFINWKVMKIVNEAQLIEEAKSIRSLTLLSIGIVFILAVLFAVLMSKSIASNINKLQAAIKKAAKGDLLVRTEIKSKDEFGQLSDDFNEMISHFESLIKNLKTSSFVVFNIAEVMGMMSGEINTAASEAALTVTQLAQGSMEQAKDIGHSVESLGVLASNIDNIESLAATIENMSVEANKLSESGLKVMEVLLQKTKEGNIQTENVSSVVMDMNKSSEEIGLITNTINNIADQTNLLALNAAIEAARAGEAGKGFAVVAEEIRKLAEQSTVATKQIQELINMINAKSNLAAEAIGETKVAVEAQNQSVAESMRLFESISQAIRKLQNEIIGTRTAINETKQKKDEILVRMQNISAVAEESSASAEEVAAATEEVSATIGEFANAAGQLKEVSDSLEAEIGKFIVGEDK